MEAAGVGTRAEADAYGRAGPAPSPRRGEGWGEGSRLATISMRALHQSPSPRASSLPSWEKKSNGLLQALSSRASPPERMAYSPFRHRRDVRMRAIPALALGALVLPLSALAADPHSYAQPDVVRVTHL